MSDLIRCVCGSCGAKYRLPTEFAGRQAKCKKCGSSFEVPREKTLEDSVLDWLGEEQAEETPVEQPRIISMPKGEVAPDQAKKAKGPIRLKSQ